MAVGVEADVSKLEDLQRMIDTAVSTYGRLDVMVNNAGIETRTSVLDTTEGQRRVPEERVVAGLEQSCAEPRADHLPAIPRRPERVLVALELRHAVDVHPLSMPYPS